MHTLFLARRAILVVPQTPEVTPIARDTEVWRLAVDAASRSTFIETPQETAARTKKDGSEFPHELTRTLTLRAQALVMAYVAITRTSYDDALRRIKIAARKLRDAREVALRHWTIALTNVGDPEQAHQLMLSKQDTTVQAYADAASLTYPEACSNLLPLLWQIAYLIELDRRLELAARIAACHQDVRETRELMGTTASSA